MFLSTFHLLYVLSHYSHMKEDGSRCRTGRDVMRKEDHQSGLFQKEAGGLREMPGGVFVVGNTSH